MMRAGREGDYCEEMIEYWRERSVLDLGSLGKNKEK